MNEYVSKIHAFTRMLEKIQLAVTVAPCPCGLSALQTCHQTLLSGLMKQKMRLLRTLQNVILSETGYDNPKAKRKCAAMQQLLTFL